MGRIKDWYARLDGELKMMLWVSIVIIGIVVFLTCNYKNLADVKSWGQDHNIAVYSGGNLIGNYHAHGKVHNSRGSDGYEFYDANTGQAVRVSGDVIITVASKEE